MEKKGDINFCLDTYTDKINYNSGEIDITDNLKNKSKKKN